MLEAGNLIPYNPLWQVSLSRGSLLVSFTCLDVLGSRGCWLPLVITVRWKTNQFYYECIYDNLWVNYLFYLLLEMKV
jgi:hypothetical protein